MCSKYYCVLIRKRKTVYNQNSEFNVCVYTPNGEYDIQIRDIKNMNLKESIAVIT